MYSEGRKKFVVLSSAKIKTSRSAVISKYLGSEGYTIGQQIDLRENGKIVPIFIKGAIHIDSLDGLYELRDALNEAIKIEEIQKDSKKSIK